MERGGPGGGASDRAGVLEDDDAFESDSIEAGGPRSLESYPGHDIHVLSSTK